VGSKPVGKLLNHSCRTPPHKVISFGWSRTAPRVASTNLQRRSLYDL